MSYALRPQPFFSLLFVALVAFAATAHAESPNRPPNEIPMYGGIAKTPEMQETDRKFLKAVRKTGQSFEDASRHAAQRGWQAFQRGDFSTAMKRLNQAWLLDKENGGVYWGFAIVVQERDNDFAASDKFFRWAIELIPRNIVLIQDYAKVLGMRGAYTRNTGDEKMSFEYFRESNKYYQKALSIDDKADRARGGMASNYWNLKNPELAFHHAKTAVKRNEGQGFWIVELVRCLMNKGIEPRVDPSTTPAIKECAAWAEDRIR